MTTIGLILGIIALVIGIISTFSMVLLIISFIVPISIGATIYSLLQTINTKIYNLSVKIFENITCSLNTIVTDKHRYEHPEIHLTVEKNEFKEFDTELSYSRIIIRSQVCKFDDEIGKDISYEELEENRIVASQLFVTFLRTVINKASDFVIDNG